MKKFIVFMMLCASFIVANGQTKTDSAGVSPDVKYLTETLSNGVQSIAKDLHVMPEEVYGVMQKQVGVEIYYCNIWIWISIIVIILTIIAIKVISILDNKYDWDNNGIALSIGFGLAIIIIISIVLCCSIQELIQLQQNPEYWIFKQLIP